MDIGSGMEYMPVATNFLDTDEGFALMDGMTDVEAFANLGRFLALKTMIVGRGPILEVSSITMRRLARSLGMNVGELEEFVGHCCECGLFHQGLWVHARVITSEDMQREWRNAKKRGAMTKKWERYSLLDGGEPPVLADLSSAEAAEDFGTTPSTICTQAEAAEDCGNKRKGKERKEKRRKENETESVSQVVTAEVFDNSADGRPPNPAQGDMPCACLAQQFDGKAFVDAEGVAHRTAYGALEARYRQKTQRRDFANLMAKVCDLCPKGCRASPAEVSECHALIAHALDMHDPTKGTPWALVRHVLTEDRGA